jgi:hypothetical protein
VEVDSLVGEVVSIASWVAMSGLVDGIAEALLIRVHQYVESVLAWTKR